MCISLRAAVVHNYYLKLKLKNKSAIKRQKRAERKKPKCSLFCYVV